MPLPAKGDVETGMGLAFPVHALVNLSFPKQLDSALLQHPRPDATQHMGSALTFHDDTVDAV
jgi:hypothetical protein